MPGFRDYVMVRSHRTDLRFLSPEGVWVSEPKWALHVQTMEEGRQALKGKRGSIVLWTRVAPPGASELPATYNQVTDEIYKRAVDATGLTFHQLQTCALKVFASMLYRAMERVGESVITGTKIVDGRLDCEVDIWLRGRPPEWRKGAAA